MRGGDGSVIWSFTRSVGAIVIEDLDGDGARDLMLRSGYDVVTLGFISGADAAPLFAVTLPGSYSSTGETTSDGPLNVKRTYHTETNIPFVSRFGDHDGDGRHDLVVSTVRMTQDSFYTTDGPSPLLYRHAAESRHSSSTTVRIISTRDGADLDTWDVGSPSDEVVVVYPVSDMTGGPELDFAAEVDKPSAGRNDCSYLYFVELSCDERSMTEATARFDVLDGTTHAKIWSVPRPTWDSYAAPFHLDLNGDAKDDAFYVDFDAWLLTAFDGRDGTVLWTHDLDISWPVGPIGGGPGVDLVALHIVRATTMEHVSLRLARVDGATGVELFSTTYEAGVPLGQDVDVYPVMVNDLDGDDIADVGADFYFVEAAADDHVIGSTVTGRQLYAASSPEEAGILGGRPRWRRRQRIVHLDIPGGRDAGHPDRALRRSVDMETDVPAGPRPAGVLERARPSRDRRR